MHQRVSQAESASAYRRPIGRATSLWRAGRGILGAVENRSEPQHPMTVPARWADIGLIRDSIAIRAEPRIL